mgnify:CR=1 FL=1
MNEKRPVAKALQPAMNENFTWYEKTQKTKTNIIL